MAAALSFGPAPALKAAGVLPAAAAGTGISPAAAAKARSTAQDFEAVFLGSMFGQMFAGTGEGPFSGGQAAKTWRSFLTDEYAKNFAKAGGVGIADAVYKELIAQQEARVK
jgi:Rod binding domain-containing protein